MEQAFMATKDQYSELARALGIKGDAFFDDPLISHKEVVEYAKELKHRIDSLDK